jgi:hypothetical protein
VGRRHLVVGFVVALSCRIGFDPVTPGGGDGGAGGTDAHVACTPADDAQCTAAGGTCDAGICTIQPDPGDAVTCPAMVCHVLCEAGECASNTMTCPPGGTCSFECLGANACTNATFTCVNATCDVHCAASATCNGLDLEGSAATCEVHCCGANNVCNAGVLNGCTLGNACP